MALKLIKDSSGTLTIEAPAKVNLFLEIIGKRPDGFHDINSLFQAVSLCDRLTFRLTDQPGIDIKTTSPVDFATDHTNLIAKAYEQVRDKFDLKTGLDVILEKNIPVAAGLGGGSADAAATIAALNSLLELNLTSTEMASIGLAIGSDIPFFFSPGQALVRGRGEIIQPEQFPTNYTLILVTPRLAISTAEAYAGLKMDLTKPKYPFKLTRCSTVQSFVELVQLSVNDFEKMHFLSYPVMGRIKHGLQELGASLIRLSGSGPTIFGLFTEASRFDIGDFNSEDDWQVHVAKPVILTNSD